MPLQATSGAASQDGFGGNGVPVIPNYIEEVFSTWLYIGTGASQTIINGIDLATKGGLTWIKSRDFVDNNVLFDTARGATRRLSSDLTNAEIVSATSLTAFTTSGFSLGNNGAVNGGDFNYASWTFRKQPKFFDVVTYTGNGTSGRTIAHNLGSAPGFMIVKVTSTSDQWCIYHRSQGATKYGLFTTAAFDTYSGTWNNTEPTSTVFTVGNDAFVNASGATYVAYLFAHDAGGFGLTGTDNVISCGSYTGNGSATGPVVTLGYEPQWILIKDTTDANEWHLFDTMRGIATGGIDPWLEAQSSGAEQASDNMLSVLATGFQPTNATPRINTSGAAYIYIAIRRGPMKVPTDATKVFQPVAYTGTNVDNRLVDTGILTDMTMARIRTATSTGSFYTADRLRGNTSLGTAITDAENSDADSFMTPTLGYGNSFAAMNGFGVGNDTTRQLNQSSTAQLAYAFRRAPSVFDEVCFTGTNSANQRVAHNLGVAPELIITKSRSTTGSWFVYAQSQGISKYSELNSNGAFDLFALWGTSVPTSVDFGLNSLNIPYNGVTVVAYLFATCAGVSKVGSYTGNGSTQTINCGFTGGARFVLIKKSSGTGDWMVSDSARGIVSGNDPYLELNNTNAEVTGEDWLDTDSTGFVVNEVSGSNANTNGATYIFLAIA